CSLGFRVKHEVKFLDGLHQPVKPQIIKFRLYIQVRSAVELGEPFQMNDSFGFTGQHHYVKRCLEQSCLFSQVRVFKFLCYRIGGREEEGIKAAQEIGPAGTPFNAVIEQLNVPLVHLAPPITSWSKDWARRRRCGRAENTFP